MRKMNNTSMNCSNECGDCETGEVIPSHFLVSPTLLTAALVHCYTVFALGTLGNIVALWCVVRCPKTVPAVKVLLSSVFVPLLVICLLTRPAMANSITAILNCDPSMFFTKLRVVMILLYSTLAEMELVAIAAVAFFRMLAVCDPQRQALRMSVAVAVVVSISLYCILTTLGMVGSVILGYVRGPQLQRVLFLVFFFFNTTIPILVTVACYSYMIYTVQGNKRSLARSQQSPGVNRAVDQATRAMLAVFFSNLLFGFPHAVYHLLDKPPFTFDIAFHILFSTHFVVDPVVFVWFNHSYRCRVGEVVRRMAQCCTSRNSPTRNQSSSCTNESISRTKASSSTKESSFTKESSVIHPQEP